MKLPKISTQGLLVIAALLQIVWGFVPSASKFVIDEIPVELYIAIRWTISGFIFAGYLYATKTWKSVAVKDVLAVSLLGILGYGAASLGTLYGLKIGGVTNFALMGALGPAITSMVAILILKERPTRLFYLALPLSILGLTLIVVGKYQLSSISVAGISAGLIVLAYILEAFVFVFSKKFRAAMSFAQYLAIAQIATALLMWTLQFTSFHQTPDLKNLTTRGILAAIFVSVVACVLCYAILYWLLNHIDGHRLALFDGFHTLSATLFGYILFKESLGPIMLIGGALILIGLVAGNFPKRTMEEIPE
jgi:drug/metabolite transporter (DMT)-like permease